jgi:hypothetical protein
MFMAAPLSSTKLWVVIAVTNAPRFAAMSSDNLSFEILPVEIKSNLGGEPLSQKLFTKSSSLVTTVRSSVEARALISRSEV